MKNVKYLILSVAAILSMASCLRKENAYTPAEKEEGTRYYFTSVEKTVKVTPELNKVSVDVFRTDLVEAKNKINVSDTSAAHLFYTAKEVEVSFNAKENKTTINFPVDMSKLQIGRKYAVVFTVPEAIATAYAADAIKVIVDYPEPWVAFDKPGTFQDNYYFAGNGSWDVSVEQNGLYPNRYRVATPYKGLLGSSMTATASDYLEFEILKSGDVLNGVTLTEDGIVVFSECNIGYHHSTYDEDIVWIHVSDPFLANKSWYAEEQTMKQFLRTSVIEWIDKDNLVPGIIQFDPFYMLKGLYGGWWAEGDKTVTLIMPDYIILDTTVDVAFNYFVFDAKYNPAVSVAVTLGEDVALAKALVVQGDDVETALEGILENENAVDVIESGDVILPLPADAETGKWSVMVASFSEDGDDLKAGDAAYVSFNFVKAGDTPNPALWEYGPSDIVDGMSKADILASDWSLYGGYYDSQNDKYEPIQKLGALSITDFVEVDPKSEEDTLLVKGMSLGLGEYYGFDDTLPFEYYEGVVYNLANEPHVVNIQGTDFYIQAEIGYEMSGQHYGSSEDDYLILGGVVADGVLAFVDSGEYEDYGVSYDGYYYWSAYTYDASADKFSWVTDLVEITNFRFVAEDGNAGAPAPAAAARLKAIKKSYSHRTNYVETNRAYLHRCIDEHKMPKNFGMGTKQVIESGKVFKKVDVGAVNR